MAGLIRQTGSAVYERTPSWMQSSMFELEGLRLQRDRYGGAFSEMLEESLSRLRSPRKMSAVRDRRMAAQLQTYKDSIPAIRERLQGIAARSHKVRELLAELPVVTKRYIANRQSDFENTQVGGIRYASTGGTTGDPWVFPVTRRAVQEQWATWWRYRIANGIDFGTWSAHFGGKTIVPIGRAVPPYWRRSHAGRFTYFSPHHLNRNTVTDYVGEIVRSRATWLHGYPTVLTSLATLMREQDLDLSGQIRWVTTGAEGLSPAQRQLLREVFQCEVRQHYGQVEGVANISECPLGKLHVDEDFAYVEFLDAGDGNYRILGTSLTNEAMGLVRYDTGDLATLPNSEITCPCEFGGRIVESLEGRDSDFVRLEGGFLLGPVNQIAKEVSGLFHLQLIDRGRNRITARVVCDPQAMNRVVDQVEAGIHARSPVPIDLEVETAKRPLISKGGKALAVVQEPVEDE